jgi:predicted dehydrogenase
MSVRFGILSTARINEQVLAGARESELVEVAAVASRDQARAEEYAREHGIARAYGGYEELVDALYRAAETGEAVSSSTGRSAMIGGD